MWNQLFSFLLTPNDAENYQTNRFSTFDAVQSIYAFHTKATSKCQGSSCGGGGGRKVSISVSCKHKKRIEMLSTISNSNLPAKD